jgi:medium-chain acyl-[acyl-carrier-protein] hydrolase
MNQLVDALCSASSGHFDKPFAFFGHSMGATISFELAHKLYAERGLQPEHMFISGRRAPQIPEDDPPTFNLPEPEFIQEVRRLDGPSPEVLDNQELLALLVPILRADFELIQTYRYRARPRLECPITVLGGVADKEVSCEHLEAWREQSTGPFKIHSFPGNHFFLHDGEKTILQIVERQLSSLLGYRNRGSSALHP